MGESFKFLLMGLTAFGAYCVWRQYANDDRNQNPIEGNPGKFKGSVQPGQKYYARSPLDARQDQGAKSNQPWAQEIFNNLPMMASDRPGDNNYSTVNDLWNSLDLPGQTGKDLSYFSGGIGN